VRARGTVSDCESHAETVAHMASSCRVKSRFRRWRGPPGARAFQGRHEPRQHPARLADRRGARAAPLLLRRRPARQPGPSGRRAPRGAPGSLDVHLRRGRPAAARRRLKRGRPLRLSAAGGAARAGAVWRRPGAGLARRGPIQRAGVSLFRRRPRSLSGRRPRGLVHPTLPVRPCWGPWRRARAAHRPGDARRLAGQAVRGPAGGPRRNGGAQAGAQRRRARRGARGGRRRAPRRALRGGGAATRDRRGACQGPQRGCGALRRGRRAARAALRHTRPRPGRRHARPGARRRRRVRARTRPGRLRDVKDAAVVWQLRPGAQAGGHPVGVERLRLQRRQTARQPAGSGARRLVTNP